MYEINLSTIMLIGIDNKHTKVITTEDEFVVEYSVNKIIDESCKYFGSTLYDRTKATSRIINITSKCPIVIEDSRNIIFFPLKSIREKENIWISFNHLSKYEKNDKKTILYFSNNKQVEIDISYYIIDNQVTRSMMLDYEIIKRRESFKK